MSTKYTISIRATSITICPGGDAIDLLEPLINLLTYEDEYVEETKTLGYMYDQESDLLYVHKGVDINYLQRLLGSVEIVDDGFDEFDHMRFEYEEIIPPRNNEQVDVINFIAGLNQHRENATARQLFLVKQPGFG